MRGTCKGALWAVLAGLLLAGGPACGAPQMATPAPIYLRVACATALLPAMEDLAAAYTARHSEVTLDVQGSGTAASLSALRAGSADLAVASWKADASGTPTPSDGLTWQPFALDGIAVIVNARNSLEALDLETTRQLFAGWYLDWSELEGRGGEILIASREDGSGTRSAFEADVMGDSAVTQAAWVMPSSAAVAEWVAENAGAVGYVSFTYITDTVRALTLEGIEPTLDEVEAGRYPLSSPAYLVTDSAPSRHVQQFVQFCLSPAGQELLGEHYARLP